MVGGPLPITHKNVQVQKQPTRPITAHRPKPKALLGCITEGSGVAQGNVKERKKEMLLLILRHLGIHGETWQSWNILKQQPCSKQPSDFNPNYVGMYPTQSLLAVCFSAVGFKDCLKNTVANIGLDNS